MRAQSGTTLIEMLIAALIMAFVSTAFLAILLTTYKTSAKVTNITDTATAVRLVKEKLGADIRQGRTLGDVYGTGFWDPAPGATGAVWIPQGVAKFPGSQNPVYGAGQAPPAGWPTAWPTGGGVASPYVLSNTCLIVQIPILDNHNDTNTSHATDSSPGWPTAIFPASYVGYPGPGNPAVTGSPYDNVETHVYQVLPDPNNPGEWKLEWCSFPGYPITHAASYTNDPNTGHQYVPAAHSMQPQVLLKGIIGPLDNTGQPHIFQFVDKTDATGTARDSILPDESYISNYTGVVINLEVRQHNEDNLKRKDISLQPIGFKTEIFLRNNAIATTNGGH